VVGDNTWIARCTGGQAPNHAAGLLLANWFVTYVWMSTRFKKGIDNNVAPHEGLETLGEAAVKSGKLS
ncbi:uncharacterized protein N7458_011549, partial [Penicillium daleae]